MSHIPQKKTRDLNNINNIVKLVQCCEVGCNAKIETSSTVKCAECQKPMCQTCKNHAIEFVAARGRCDMCCWWEIT
jgi:hypothetical protein